VNLRKANDEIEKTIVIPAHEEISSNERKKLNISNRVKEIENEVRSTKHDEAFLLVEMEQENEKIVNVIANLSTVLRAKEEECLEIDRAHKDFKSSVEAEIEETKKRRDQLKDVTNLQKEGRVAAFRLAVLKSAAALLDEAVAIENKSHAMKRFWIIVRFECDDMLATRDDTTYSEVTRFAPPVHSVLAKA